MFISYEHGSAFLLEFISKEYFLYVLKAKLVKFVFCLLFDPYILEVIYMGLVQLSSVVSCKRYVSACTISTKGKMSLLSLCVLLILKSKL